MEIEQVYRIAYEAFTRALDQKLTTPDNNVSIAPKFYRGSMVLKPQDPADLEVFFKKIVSVRNNLRVMEQKINGSGLDEAAKVELQGYITKCYGSLTTFNILFQDPEDRFVGAKEA